MKRRTILRKFALLAAGLFCSATMMAQVATRGVVTDAAGEPVIGASVLVEGTSVGTITDYDGNFELSAPNGSKLIISYIGFKNHEAVVNGSYLTVVLQEDAELLDEVVVVGYGVVKKNDATGSVTAIKPDEMNKGLNTNMQDMLQGKVAGVNITTNGGAPGTGASIRIRGGSSLSASNDPLIVIDGLAMDNNGIQGVSNPLSMVNPNDIETLTVLKDASATAIYGSRASNGVIIITTKKGKAGTKPQFSYEGNVSVGALVNRLQVLNAQETRQFAEWWGYSEKQMSKLGDANTDWQSEIFQLAPGTDHNFTISGGTKHMPYRASLGYTYQDGTIKTSNMQRVTAAINLSPSFFDKHLNINLNAKGMYIYNRYTDGGGLVGAALSMDPTQSVKDDTYGEIFGGYYQGGVQGSENTYGDPVWNKTINNMAVSNPVATLAAKNDRANAGSFVGNIEADYQIHGFEDLRLHANFGADYSYGKQTTSIQPWSYSNHYYGWEGFSLSKKYNLSFNCYAQYYKDFNENHHFDIMAGYEWQHFYREGTSEGSGFVRDTYTGVGKKNPLTPGDKYNEYINPWATENYLVSFFGRANYTALNRYMITATVRGDGSSRFHKDHRWGVFPSVALGWKIKEEAFLRDVYWLNDLKLRLGYGITGQQELGLGDYPYLAVYQQNKDYAYYPAITNADGTPYITYRPNAVNPELTWEKTATSNIGIDFGFLRSRITGSIEYYHRRTSDLINVIDVPAGTNFRNRVISNVGNLTNQGVEFSIDATAIDTKKLRWDIGFNMSWNENKITKLTTGDNADYYIGVGSSSMGSSDDYLTIHKVDEAANSFYVYKHGRFDDGSIGYINRDGELVDESRIDECDRYIYHNTAPVVQMGLNMKWQFYGFDLGFSLRSNIGNYVYNDVLASNLNNVQKGEFFSAKSSTFKGLLVASRDLYWNEGIAPTGHYYLTDYFVENASFVRCDNITLGYTWNKDKIKARLYATVQNPFVITGYRGLDPEVNSGIDTNIYPRCMTTLVGCSLQF